MEWPVIYFQFWPFPVKNCATLQPLSTNKQTNKHINKQKPNFTPHSKLTSTLSGYLSVSDRYFWGEKLQGETTFKQQIPKPKQQRNTIIERCTSDSRLSAGRPPGSSVWVNFNQPNVSNWRWESNTFGMRDALIHHVALGTCGANWRVTVWRPWEKIVETDHWWLPPTKSYRLVIKRPTLTWLQSSLKLDGYRGNAATQRAVESGYYYYFKINRLFLGTACGGLAGRGCVTCVSQMFEL